MNAFYNKFIEQGRRLARERNLTWDLPVNDAGEVPKTARWDLAKICGLPTPPYFWVSSLGVDGSALTILNEGSHNATIKPQRVMPPSWRDFYLAAILNEILIKRNRPAHALLNVGRPIKILSAYADSEEPWELSAATVQRAYGGALNIGGSGKVAANLAMVIRTTLDGYHISNNHPLASYCKAASGKAVPQAEERVSQLRKGNNTYRNTDKIRTELSSRKGSEKLPSAKAFAELLRIVFTEQPLSFADAIRFDQIKVALITGFRIGENVMLPVDWARWHEYRDQNGLTVDSAGGVARSLSIRNFAEKKPEATNKEGFALYESAQHVPLLLEEALVETLTRTERITRPLRERLRLQVESGRLFPEYEPQDLVPLSELYVRVSGSIRVSEAPLQGDLVTTYRKTYESRILDQIYQSQMEALALHGAHRQLSEYWDRLNTKYGLRFRRWDGSDCKAPFWKRSYLKIGELEDFIRKNIPSKLPDTATFQLNDGGNFSPAELMYLMPIRGLADERDGGVLDINRYFAIGRSLPTDLQLHLGGRPNNNIFSRYGKTEEDRLLSLNTHSLRHLQNAELLRQDVSDAIVTKRFNRRSVTQTYVYDHRSLSEDLAAIELPPEAESMPPKSQDVLRLILADRVRGPIIDEFLRIQTELGDSAAFDYLSAEADGLHVTPYGMCVNSFTVDPCPKHLECFNGCRHLTRTPIHSEQESLEKLRLRMSKVVKNLEDSSEKTQVIGWRNQLAHAKTRLSNIEKVLASAPGEVPFPDGRDLYQSAASQRGTTLMDVKPKIWSPE